MKKCESGRSMVEMLGVLAIIGVLSIGAVNGYNYAIHKYLANETINEINLRLTTLQMQATQDTDLNLSEFSDTTPQGYTVGDNYGWAEDDTRIYIGLSGIPQKTCKILEEEMTSQMERIDIIAEHQTGTDSPCGDTNEMKFYIDSGMTAGCVPPCPAGTYCTTGGACVPDKEPDLWKYACETDGDCPECTQGCWEGHASGKYCNPVPNNGIGCNLADGSVGVCTNGECLPKAETTCQSHTDCGEGEYCAIKNTTDCEPISYGCAPIEFVRRTITLSNGKQETWYLSNQLLDWWNAKAACEAIGKKLPTKAELELYDREQKIDEVADWGWKWTATESEENCALAQVAGGQPGEIGEFHNKGNSHVFLALCR